jgi:NAD(P)-dependent dehydrogenase (short-subunit alcohol dehydrogenase family)
VERFQDRVVIVTGAASGIGRAMSEQFAAEGAKVVGADLDAATVPEAALGVEVDVSRPEDVQRLADYTVETFGRVDVLCNNAGIGSTTDVLNCSPDEWDNVFAVNARGVFLGIRAVLPQMLAQGAGVIVNTASVAGLVGLPDRAAYCASKGAVVALTRQVAIQLAGTGVRCNCLCPGTVDSPWVGRLLADAEDPRAHRQQLVRRQPMGRLGTPDEVAHAALFLASDEASFITGTELVIDGGIHAG